MITSACFDLVREPECCMICKRNHVQGDQQATQLTPGDGSALSPRFSPDGKRLIYLSHRAAVTSGTYGGADAVDMIYWLPADSGAGPLTCLPMPQCAPAQTVELS